jgi:hypothetical protein
MCIFRVNFEIAMLSRSARTRPVATTAPGLHEDRTPAAMNVVAIAGNIGHKVPSPPRACRAEAIEAALQTELSEHHVHR